MSDQARPAGGFSDSPVRDARPAWRMWTEIVVRLALVVLGVPAIWVLRAIGILDVSVWHAIGGTVVLALIALVGPHLPLPPI